ncbi:DUF1919 domain-containing protein [Butyrivibrio sp. AE2032]|uniref:DUF1919 domain-containing protein n=1 Tax=Butyrivibrio sp. AE2032 TaxID=1458463 RepID=UPI0005595400|nr:DUF1919 domain-containing protein [Butyrivibrio sp. AE2032]
MNRNDSISIISNNCIGADISRKCGLRYNSPTVNLQILPSDFPVFVNNLKYFLSLDVVERVSFSSEENAKIQRTYGCQAEKLGFPIGEIDGLLVCFQHFKSFAEAREAWNRRKERVNYENLAVVMIEKERFMNEFIEFDKVYVKKKIAFTINFEMKLANTFSIPIYVPEGKHFLDCMDGNKSYYEKDFSPEEWINS